MKRVIALTVAVAALVALPAQAGPPIAKQLAELKRQVAVLQSKVGTLSARNENLAETNRELRGDTTALEAELGTLRRHVATTSACPVTTPNGSNPPGVAASESGGIHGNGRLWVSIAYDGVIPAGKNTLRSDGSIGTKFPWWRGDFGELKIAGVRLDGVAPPLRADVPSGYGTTGFQASGIDFPTVGCWEVTGRAGLAVLTFVVLVVRV